MKPETDKEGGSVSFLTQTRPLFFVEWNADSRKGCPYGVRGGWFPY